MKTAAELMAELQADPEYVRRQEQQRAERERKVAAWREAEAPLVEALRAAGFEVESAWDLVNTATPYPAALPILLDHLERPYPDRVREGIARSLAVGDAKFAWPTLSRLYRDEPAGSDAKSGLAVALAASADDEVVDDLIALVGDPAHGDSRVLLLWGLGRSQTQKARVALEELREDPRSVGRRGR